MQLKGRSAKIVSIVVVVISVLFIGQQTSDTPEVTTDDSSQTAGVDHSTDVVRYSDLPTIGVDELPSEALETLERIESGGPHPYQKDGSTFQNREGILPDQQIGYYQEFTVDTPGSSDRGARRIVSGEESEQFYTADHYASFVEIVG